MLLPYEDGGCWKLAHTLTGYDVILISWLFFRTFLSFYDSDVHSLHFMHQDSKTSEYSWKPTFLRSITIEILTSSSEVHESESEFLNVYKSMKISCTSLLFMSNVMLM